MRLRLRRARVRREVLPPATDGVLLRRGELQLPVQAEEGGRMQPQRGPMLQLQLQVRLDFFLIC